jgi:hypothetical protein
MTSVARRLGTGPVENLKCRVLDIYLVRVLTHVGAYKLEFGLELTMLTLERLY